MNMPYTDHTNMPYTDHTNMPYTDHTNRPYTDHTNMPYTDHTNMPYTDHTNMPYTDHTNMPYTDYTNMPYTDHTGEDWLSSPLPYLRSHNIRVSLQLERVNTVSVSVSVSAQDGIVALGKAHTRSSPSFSSLPKVALETVPIFVWLNTDRSRPWRVECRPLPFSTPLFFRRSML